MDRAYVVMTAMPPTTGHLQLIKFAGRISTEGKVTVIVGTQPSEPYAYERYAALRDAVRNAGMLNVDVKWFNTEIEQNPDTPGFRAMWTDIYRGFGCGAGDYIVASETYGKWLADMTGASFYPYDIDRSLNPIKATRVRGDLWANFQSVLPEFQRYLLTKVTIFGAESIGKTTLAKALHDPPDSQWLFEYARPYLENTSTDITVDSMTAIWRGQRALQEQAYDFGVPCIIQDTDLFSTVGYWGIPHWRETLGDVPSALVTDALCLQSDLYIILKSDIPFEEDPLRYGGDKRETDDQYWIDICEEWELNYVVLDATSLKERVQQATQLITALVETKFARLNYDRHGH